MIHAPVKIVTLCRYEHFRRCVESLSRCSGASQTELFIGLDYPKDESHWPGYRKILEYVDTIQGFKDVHVFKRDVNYGQSKNSKDLRNRICMRYDRYISTEDDNEFSPNFLEYMNQCLEKYKDDPRVAAVCGYSYREWENLNDYAYNAYPLQGFCSWGAGFWESKEIDYRQFISAKEIIFSWKHVRKLFHYRMHTVVHRLMYRYETAYGDLRRRCYCAFNDQFCIFPRLSKVRNHGFDGSGTNCTIIDAFESQIIDQEREFHLDAFEIKKYPAINVLHDRIYSANLLQRVLIWIEYLQFRLTKKVFRDYTLIKRIQRWRVKKMMNTKESCSNS